MRDYIFALGHTTGLLIAWVLAIVYHLAGAPIWAYVCMLFFIFGYGTYRVRDAKNRAAQ